MKLTCSYFDSSTIWKEYIQNIYTVQSVKCSAHLSNYWFLSFIISPTHLALWLNRVELTGNFPFLEWCLIQAVSSNVQPFSSAHCCTWQIRRFLAIAAGQGHQWRLTKDRGLSNPGAFALSGIMPLTLAKFQHTAVFSPILSYKQKIVLHFFIKLRLQDMAEAWINKRTLTSIKYSC